LGEQTQRAALAVLVRDATGAPVAGARVAADALEPPEDRWESDRWMPAEEGRSPPVTATTDASGRASISGIKTGRWRVVVDATGFVKRAAECAWVEGDPPREVTVTLDRPCSLDVLVRDKAGGPAAGVVVRAVDFNGRPWPLEWTATTGEGGTCRIEGLPRGTLAVACKSAEKDDRVFVEIPEVAHVELVAPPTAAEIAKTTATLEVRVVDRYGAPIPGADVVFSFESGQQTARGTSGDDGVCRAIAVAKALACVERIVARSAGHATARRGMSLVQVGAGESHRFDDIVLEPEARLEGHVVGPEGPIAGAKVTVWVPGAGHFGEMERSETTTTSDGTYHAVGLPTGTVVVEASAPGLDPVDADSYGHIAGSFGPRVDQLDEVPESAKVVLVAGNVATRDVRMKRTGPAKLLRATFTGLVRRKDGTPVPWAEVWATGSTDHWFVRDAGHAVSAADGSFSVTAEAAEGFRLHASAWGLWTHDGVDVPTSEAGTRGGIEIVLDPRPMVRGVVRSALGRAVGGGHVLVGTHHSHKFNEATHWDEEPEGVVAADGSYEVPVVTGPFGGSDHDMRQDDMVLLVEVDGHGPAISAPFTPEDLAAGKSIDFTLDEGAEIAGRVVDGGAAPVPDAAITLVIDNDWNTENWPPRHPPLYGETLAARTGADGSFSIRHLFAGRYTIATTVPGCVAESMQVTAPTKGLELRVRASLAIAGMVFGPDGAPLPGAELELAPVSVGADSLATVSTADDGVFRFDHVPAGTWRLVVVPSTDGPDAQPLSMDVVAGTMDLRVRTKAGLAIAGTLLDADGKPVAGAKVRVGREDSGPEVRGETLTDEAGRFVFRHRAPGRHRLNFWDLDLAFEGIDAPSSPALRVPGKLTITGKVRDRAGEKTPFVGVRARRVDAPQGEPIDVHDGHVEDGAFAIKGLGVGQYAIEVSGNVSDPRHSWEWKLMERTVLSAGTADANLMLDLIELPRGRSER
jgi:uncharacterized GH25 family protein